MRITSVELHPAGSSAVCVLSFRDPSRLNPYNVKTIIGLDADELVAKNYGGGGSARFFNVELQKREPVMRIELNPRPGLGETNSSLRDAIYRMISSSRTSLMDIQFKDGSTVVAVLSGFVSKVEAPHFEKIAEVQITFRCDDPMLRAPAALSVPVGALDPGLTIIEDDVSTAPHGFKFEMVLTAPVNDFVIEDPDDDTWSFALASAGLQVGDHIRFSSEYNDKYIDFVRAGIPWGLANKIVPGSIWPVMFPKPNKFSISPEASVDWVSISYRPAFWGV